MRNKEEIFEWIEEYLSGNLKGDDLNEFESKLQNEPEFAQQVSLHRELAMVIPDENEEKLEGILGKLGEEFSSQEEPKVKPLLGRRSFLAIAASIAALIAIGILFNQFFSSPNHQQLFETFYQAYDAPGDLRSGESSLDSLLTLGLEKYNSGAYAEAIPILQEILNQKPNDPIASFLMGLSQIEEKNLSAAESALQIVINDGTSLLVDQSQWYLALIYLKQENTEQAKTLLNALSLKPGKYSSLAEELLNEL